MRLILNLTTIFVVLVGTINFGHAFDISTFESQENDIDFNFNEIDFESHLIVNGKDQPIDKDIAEDSKLDTVRRNGCRTEHIKYLLLNTNGRVTKIKSIFF